MDINDEYDIVIIGAGPAGSTFARLACDGIKKILLIDGQSEQNKKPCGGLLAPDAQKALAHLGLVLPSHILVDPQIFSVKTIDLCAGLTKYYSRHYLNIDRFAFDKWLVSLVPPEVEKFCGRCLKISGTDNSFELTIACNGKINTIRAKNIVGADGANSLVRRTFFKDKIIKYVAIQQWFEDAGSENPFYSCIFDSKTSESCSWSIYKNKKFIFGGCFPAKKCRLAFEEQKKRLAKKEGFIFKNCIKTEACLALRPKNPWDFKTGKKGVFLIGEAAGFISPSSFEGISSALVSGHLLACAFNRNTGIKTEKIYRLLTFKLRAKIFAKIIKRWFMYTPAVRSIIMKTGIGSINIWQQTHSDKASSTTITDFHIKTSSAEIG